MNTNVGIENDQIRIRDFKRADLPLMLKWLTDDRVLEFYKGRDVRFNMETLAEHFLEEIPDGFRMIIEYNGQAVGYGQAYQLSREMFEEYDYHNDGRVVFAMDQFIGEPDYWNRGIDSEFLKMMASYLKTSKGAACILLDPHQNNHRAIRAYEKAGFRIIKPLPEHELFEGKKRRLLADGKSLANTRVQKVYRFSQRHNVRQVRSNKTMKTNNNQDIILFEELASNAHVALNIMQYDGWILKFSEGHTNRANSVSMIYPSTISVNEKIQNCEKIYAEQNLPCVFKLTDGDEQMMKLLTERGYKEVTPSDVMVWEIDDITMPEGDITFYNKPLEEWLCPYFEYEGFSQKSQATYRRMLDKVCIKTDYVAIREQGKIVAVASSAMERGYMLIQNVVVHPDYRRKGYGKLLCKALMSKGKSHGAKTAWLQVVQTNEGAYKLYDGLGFKKVYTYRYLKKE